MQHIESGEREFAGRKIKDITHAHCKSCQERDLCDMCPLGVYWSFTIPPEHALLLEWEDMIKAGLLKAWSLRWKDRQALHILRAELDRLISEKHGK